MFSTYFNTLLNTNPTKFCEISRWYVEILCLCDFKSNQNLQTKHKIGIELKIKSVQIPSNPTNQTELRGCLVCRTKIDGIRIHQSNLTSSK